MDRQTALDLDAADPLARFRDAFDLPDGVIYLDGNSLGPLPRATRERLQQVARDEWGRDLIRSWNTAGWIEAPQRVGDKIARLVGADAGEVVVADSTSVNLFKLAAGALALQPGRRTLLVEEGDFPTDAYVLEGLCALSGATLALAARGEILDAVDDDTAAVILTHVHYKTAERWDLGAATAAIQARGALAIWDLSHSTGALALDLNGANADLAVGCGYKYLNGGPGAPAFLFVASRHQARIRTPLSGWMGHAAPFAFEPAYRPAPDIRAQLCGTPPILSLAALECGVDLQLQADKAAVEAKGLSLCRLFIDAVRQLCPDAGLVLAGPEAPEHRGLHVSFAHPQSYGIVQALIARGIIGDFRDPDISRFGFSPLYLRHTDVWDAAQALSEVLDRRDWDRAEYRQRAAVT